MITEKQKKNYIENDLQCPICGLNRFDCSNISVDSKGASQDVRCRDCDSTWTDLYVLTNIVNIKRGIDTRPIIERFEELVSFCTDMVFQAGDWDGESEQIDVPKEWFDRVYGVVRKYENN